MTEIQEKYLIETIEGFNSLGEAVRHFRQKNDNLTISSICNVMSWKHSYLMDVEFGREILTDINTIKKLAKALEIHSSMLLKLTNISQKPFIYEYELDNFRPKLLSQYEQLKKEVNLSYTLKNSLPCFKLLVNIPSYLNEKVFNKKELEALKEIVFYIASKTFENTDIDKAAKEIKDFLLENGQGEVQILSMNKFDEEVA